MRGAGVIFFAYIGFDAVSTAAQEAKNPQRDMPIGILGSLVVCTMLYIAGRARADRHRAVTPSSTCRDPIAVGDRRDRPEPGSGRRQAGRDRRARLA